MRGEALKGHLDGMLLAALAAGPAHGYMIIESLREASGGTFDLPEGTVYPALHRLEQARLIKSRFVTIRVIGHSAYASPDLSTAMTEAGADDFIIKGTLDLPYIEGLIAA